MRHFPSRRRCSRSCSRSAAPRAGWPSGSSSCRTRSRRSLAPSRSTPVTGRWTSSRPPSAGSEPTPSREGLSAVPAAVVFDLGDVLIRWRPQDAVAAGLGAAEADRFLAADDLDFGAYNREQDLGRSFAEAEAELGRTHPHWQRHAATYREHFPLSLSPIEANVAVLRELYDAGVPLYALTNWSAELFPQALARFEFLELFRDIVVSGAERVAKPDPAVFEVLRQRIGHPLTECVFIDDSQRNVEAAAAAGLDAIRVTPRT